MLITTSFEHSMLKEDDRVTAIRGRRGVDTVSSTSSELDERDPTDKNVLAVDSETERYATIIRSKLVPKNASLELGNFSLVCAGSSTNRALFFVNSGDELSLTLCKSTDKAPERGEQLGRDGHRI